MQRFRPRPAAARRARATAAAQAPPGSTRGPPAEPRRRRTAWSTRVVLLTPAGPLISRTPPDRRSWAARWRPGHRVSLPADEHGTRRDGGHAPSIAQPGRQADSVPRFSTGTDVPARPGYDAGGHGYFRTHTAQRPPGPDRVGGRCARERLRRQGPPRGTDRRPLAPGDGIMLVGWPETGPGRYHLIEARPGRSRAGHIHAGRGVLRSSQRGVGRGRATGRCGASGPGHRGHRRHRLGHADACRRQRLPGGGPGREPGRLRRGVPGDHVHRPAARRDPALLGGPDRISFYRLVHADLPIPEGSRS